MHYRTRLARLEAQRPSVTHHTPVVRVPRAIPEGGWNAYLVALPCACGARQCPRRTIGAALPEQLSVEAWEQAYRDRRER